MDLPFPELSRANIEYYLPFVIYLFAYLIAYVSKWKYRYIGGIFLSFAILRLVTLLGRSDWGHLLFALPEMLIVVAAALICIRESTFSRVALKAFLPYGSAVAILFLLAINSSSAFLAFVPFVILWSLSSNRKKIPLGKQSYFMPGIILTVFLICVTLMAYTTKDYFMSTAKMLSEELTVDESKSPRIGGMKVDPVTLKEIQDVKNVVEPLKPNTIFSFPIQPFYYSLADHHATRFMTYEPQTTVDEQLISIEELRKNKPQVVIFDPLQAQGLSGSLWMISNYITTNYQKVATVKSTNILWIMVPKKSPFYEEKIVFGLKHYMSTNGQLPLSVQNDSMGLQNAIMLNKSIDLTIDMKDKNVTALTLSLVKPADVQQELNDCGDIVVGKDRASIKKTICQSDGVVTIPIRHDEENLRITLLNSNTKMTIWNDITLR
jgi:hypothetical protein